MKRFSYGCMLLLLLAATTGCRKLIDKYFPGHNGGGTKNCKVTSITSGEATYWFTYNTRGKLDTVVSNFDPANSDGQRIDLTYDESGRLVAMHRIQGGSEYRIDIYHRYGYTGNRITTDTFFNAANSEYILWLSRITYDADQRIVAENVEAIYDENENYPVLFTEYHYDADGNLLAQPLQSEIQYSDHNNPLRTDKTLQFLARDYSRNSPSGAIGFNSADLPTQFSQPYAFTFSPPTGVIQSIIPASAIAYDCD